MSYRKVSVFSAPLTEELVAKFGEYEPSPGEREPKPARLNYLLTQIVRKTFMGVEWAYGVCRENGITYRLDGQHSLKTLRELPKGVEFPTGLIATMTEYEFDTLADVADVFNLFNNPVSVRGTEDMMGVYRARVPEFKTLSRKFLVNIGDGIHEYEKQRKAKGAKDAMILRPRARGQYLTTNPLWEAMVLWFAQFRDLKNRVYLTKSFIVSEMIAHRMANPDLAQEFWHTVFTHRNADGTPADPDCEAMILSESFRHELDRSAGPKLNPIVFRRETKKAWKSFTAGAKAA